MQTAHTNTANFDGKTSTELAFGCFTIGTLLFLLNLSLTDNSSTLLVAFFFIVIATPINLIMLLHLLHHFYILPNQRKYIGIKIVMLVSNFPIAVLYLLVLQAHQLI